MNRAMRRAMKQGSLDTKQTKSQFKALVADQHRKGEEIMAGLACVTLNLIAVAWHEVTGKYGGELQPIIHACLEEMRNNDNFVAVQEKARREAGVYVYDNETHDQWTVITEDKLDESGIEHDPRPHWIKANTQPKGYTRICSCCGERAYKIGKQDLLYCPNCGCRMEEE